MTAMGNAVSLRQASSATKTTDPTFTSNRSAQIMWSPCNRLIQERLLPAMETETEKKTLVFLKTTERTTPRWPVPVHPYLTECPS